MWGLNVDSSEGGRYKSIYWPLEMAAGVLPVLQELITIKPVLSVMHARAHATKCETWQRLLEESARLAELKTYIAQMKWCHGDGQLVGCQIHLMAIKTPHTENFSSQLRGFPLV
ncbi:uncharacterized protein isoform X3 [Danio rerio]|uniref:Uncharacterized protein isoform X3 n=2 Tax=Danio rerio TaxID=7955 RepID=A0AC58I617_DANRE